MVWLQEWELISEYGGLIMFGDEEIKKIKKISNDWEKNNYFPHKKKHPERKENFKNLSWNEIKNVYTPEDIAHLDYENDISLPGMYPFLRGVHPTMYRGRLWTFR